MKADPSLQRRLVDLADLDQRLAGYAHRRRALPEQADLDRLEAERRSAAESAARAGITAEDLDRAVTRLRSDLEAVRARRSRDGELLSAGTLSERQATEVEYELRSLARRQDTLEGELAELGERREALEDDIRHSGGRVTDLDSRLALALTVRDRALADLEEAVTATAAERAEIAGEIPEELLDLYGRSAARAGVGAAVLNGSRCGGCGMDLDRSTVAAFREGAPDEVLTCPECGVVVIRTDRP